MTRLVLAIAGLFALLAVASAAAPRAYGCAFSPIPTTYEVNSDRGAYLLAANLAGYNMIAPDDTFFGTPRVESGSRGNRTTTTPYIPPTLLKAIGIIESSLAQADGSVYWASTGPTKVSFDCGFGIMQVTSGMVSPADGGRPSAQQSLVASHYMYNIARGAAILVDKWNAAPEVRPIVGNGDPRVAESWYYAIWSYNGFVGLNNPLNPAFASWPRVPFSCGPAGDGFGHNRGLYPYQELVLGCASRPRVVDGQQLWQPLAVTLPNLNDSRWRDPMSHFPDASRMDIPRPSPSHQDPTERPGATVGPFLLGEPVLTASHGSVNGAVNEITISNSGSGILAWRATPEQSWIRVDKQAGVVLGSNVSCTPGWPCDRSVRLTITVNTAQAPPNGTPGQVTIESLTTGQRWEVSVVRGSWPYRIGVPGTIKR